MTKKNPYEEPASEILEVVLESFVNYPEPNQSYRDDPEEFRFD